MNENYPGGQKAPGFQGISTADGADRYSVGSDIAPPTPETIITLAEMIHQRAELLNGLADALLDHLFGRGETGAQKDGRATRQPVLMLLSAANHEQLEAIRKLEEILEGVRS